MYKKILEEIDHEYFKYFPATFILSIAEHAEVWQEHLSIRIFLDCIMWCDVTWGPTGCSEKQGA